MSPEKLAILLSQQQAGTPAAILVEHELNLRIAKVQSRATYVGVVAALVGTIVGAVLQPMLSQLPSPQTQQPQSVGIMRNQTIRPTANKALPDSASIATDPTHKAVAQKMIANENKRP
jgi:hypothetical protein